MHALTDNWAWKLFSVAIALALWVFFVAETEVAISLPVMVAYKNAPSDLEITTEHVDRVFMKIRGPSSRLEPATMAQTALVFDLSGIHGPGERTFTITAEEIGLPAGVKLLHAVPSQVRIGFDRQAVRSVPVKVRVTSGPPAGYRIASQNVSPASVRVVGPEARVKDASAMTDGVDLSSTIGNAEFHVGVNVSDPHLRLENPATVQVTASIEKISAR